MEGRSIYKPLPNSSYWLKQYVYHKVSMNRNFKNIFSVTSIVKYLYNSLWLLILGGLCGILSTWLRYQGEWKTSNQIKVWRGRLHQQSYSKEVKMAAIITWCTTKISTRFKHSSSCPYDINCIDKIQLFAGLLGTVHNRYLYCAIHELCCYGKFTENRIYSFIYFG